MHSSSPVCSPQAESPVAAVLRRCKNRAKKGRDKAYVREVVSCRPVLTLMRMSASQALVDVFGGGLAPSGASLASALATLVGTGLSWWFVVPRLPPRGALLLSIAIAIVLLASSFVLLWAGSIWWPAWPSVVALLFGHLGLGAAKRSTMRPVVLPQRAPVPVPAKQAAKPAAAATQPAPTLPPDRA